MKAADLVVRNAKVWSQGNLVEGGIAVKDGKIASIASDYALPGADKTVDAHGNLLIPGLVDEHVHMGDPYEGPGSEVAVMREDFVCGTMAAAAGGITTVIEMPDSVPLVTTLDAAKSKIEICKRKAYVDFSLHGGFIPGTDYATSMKQLYALGLTGFKTYTCFSIPEWPPCYDGDLYEALKVISKIGAVALLHAENDFILSINEKRLKSQGRKDIRAHLEWRPPIAEIESVRRMVFFLKEARAKGLIVHTSVPEGVLEVKQAREQGYDIYVETCPHFLFMTDEDVIKKGPWAKCAPPPRSKATVARMWELLNAGYIDTLGSDHSPYTEDEKRAGLKNIWDAGNGAANIEATLPLMMDAVNSGKTTLERAIRMGSENPARLFGLYPRKGTLQIGSDADFVIVDMKAKHKLSNENTKSKCGWMVYDGTVTKGKPTATFVRGTMIMQDGEIVGKQAGGQFITRKES